MNTVIVNGVVINGGSSVNIRSGKVIVDGVDVTPNTKEINIVVNGNVERLEVDACSKISVTGDVGNLKTQSGDVDVTGTINGSVQTMSGDVECGGPIGGNVSTMSGDVSHR